MDNPIDFDCGFCGAPAGLACWSVAPILTVAGLEFPYGMYHLTRRHAAGEVIEPSQIRDAGRGIK